MSTPSTEAGRALFSRLWAVNKYEDASKLIATVEGDLAAIEAEARQAVLEELAREVEGLPDGTRTWMVNGSLVGRPDNHVDRAAVLALIHDRLSR